VDFQEEFFEDVMWMWEVMNKLLTGFSARRLGLRVVEFGSWAIWVSLVMAYFHTYHFLPCIYITTPCTDNLGKGRHHPHMHIFPTLNKTFLLRCGSFWHGADSYSSVTARSPFPGCCTIRILQYVNKSAPAFELSNNNPQNVEISFFSPDHLFFFFDF